MSLFGRMVYNQALLMINGKVRSLRSKSRSGKKNAERVNASGKLTAMLLFKEWFLQQGYLLRRK